MSRVEYLLSFLTSRLTLLVLEVVALVGFGALVFKLLHDVISAWTPQYWNFWLGLFLVVLVLVGRDRLIRPHRWFARRGEAAR